MKKDGAFTWDDSKQIDFYLNSLDAVVVERKRMVNIVSDILRYSFSNTDRLKVLDLGCGDGSIAKYLNEKNKSIDFYLMDGSFQMLERAKENMAGENVTFIHETFEEYVTSQAEDKKYDFIFSSNAIHHMDYNGKAQVFGKIYRELRFGGAFINVDVVHPTSARSEQIQFQMWVDWINENFIKNGMSENVGKHDNLPQIYKDKTENKPSTLSDQLALLENTGFRDVECFYKYGIFVVFGGFKS